MPSFISFKVQMGAPAMIPATYLRVIPGAKRKPLKILIMTASPPLKAPSCAYPTLQPLRVSLLPP